MTVSSTTSRKTYLGDAVTTSFDTNPVAFFLTSDLLVYVVVTATGVATLLTENTHYTVSGGSGTTGTVSLAGGSSPYGALSALQTLVIVRSVPETQLVDFVNNEATDAEVAEDALDKLTMVCQQLDAAIGRSFALPSTDVSGASTVIPAPSANKVIGWNSGGTALQNYAGSDISLTLVSTFIATLIDDVDAKTARQTLILDKHGADIASAATLNLDNATGDLVDVTGTTGITAITLAEGVEKTVRFTGALTLTNGASLVLPGALNILTAAGDVAVFRGYASGVVRCVTYQRVSGQSVVSGGVTQTLTDAAPTTWDASTGAIAAWTMGASRTISAPTNLKSGGRYVLHITQDGTGGRLVTWNAVFAADGGATMPQPVQKASSTTVFVFESPDGTNLRLVSKKAQPTRTVLTSGSSSTYTTPTGATRLNIRLVGGGGGGGAQATNNGTAGNNTTFSTLTGGGGGGGVAASAGGGGAGGTAAGGDINIPGGAGCVGGSAGAGYLSGGAGGSSYFGGAGAGAGNGSAGGNAATNSGSGGAGASSSNATSIGQGGGAGGYVEKLLTSPAATYTYTVGAAANGGAAGAVAGGTGAAGIIIVDEFYD